MSVFLTYENRTLLTNRPEDQYVQLESRINTLKIIPMTIEELESACYIFCT